MAARRHATAPPPGGGSGAEEGTGERAQDEPSTPRRRPAVLAVAESVAQLVEAAVTDLTDAELESLEIVLRGAAVAAGAELWRRDDPAAWGDRDD